MYELVVHIFIFSLLIYDVNLYSLFCVFCLCFVITVGEHCKFNVLYGNACSDCTCLSEHLRMLPSFFIDAG